MKSKSSSASLNDSTEPSGCIARGVLVLARGTPPANLVRSPWMSPAMLLALRLVVALFMVSWWVVMLTAANFHDRFIEVVIYFTNMSFTGIMIISVLLAYLSLRYYRDPRAEQLARSPFTRAATSMFYAQALTYCLIVSTVYWGYLYPRYREDQKHPPYTFRGFHDVVVHGLNVVFCLIHFFSSAIHVGTWWLLAPVVGSGILYMFWTWIFHAILNKWAYSFLAFESVAAKYMYPSVMAAFFVFFILVKLAHRLRNVLVIRFRPEVAHLFDLEQRDDEIRMRAVFRLDSRSSDKGDETPARETA